MAPKFDLQNSDTYSDTYIYRIPTLPYISLNSLSFSSHCFFHPVGVFLPLCCVISECLEVLTRFFDPRPAHRLGGDPKRLAEVYFRRSILPLRHLLLCPSQHTYMLILAHTSETSLLFPPLISLFL